ncbi:hypothetical protein HRbin41_00570 [bacterium HR41]|nr:hypothetical protein HRbin41_00570 [bacterium HR41]
MLAHRAGAQRRRELCPLGAIACAGDPPTLAAHWRSAALAEFDRIVNDELLLDLTRPQGGVAIGDPARIGDRDRHRARFARQRRD